MLRLKKSGAIETIRESLQDTASPQQANRAKVACNQHYKELGKQSHDMLSRDDSNEQQLYSSTPASPIDLYFTSFDAEFWKLIPPPYVLIVRTAVLGLV